MPSLKFPPMDSHAIIVKKPNVKRELHLLKTYSPITTIELHLPKTPML